MLSSLDKKISAAVAFLNKVDEIFSKYCGISMIVFGFGGGVGGRGGGATTLGWMATEGRGITLEVFWLDDRGAILLVTLIGISSGPYSSFFRSSIAVLGEKVLHDPTERNRCE